MAELNNTFTIKITVMPDGSIDVWSKGMPDTRSFGGKPFDEVPWSHRLGLHGLQAILEGVDRAELKLKGSKDERQNNGSRV